MKFTLLAAGVVAVTAVTQVHGWAALPVHARILMCVAVDAPFILAYLLLRWFSARKPKASAPVSRPGYPATWGRR